MSEKTILWRVDYDSPRPIEVKADKPEWPNLDDDGCRIYVNTHFGDEYEAWAKLRREHEAALSLASRDLLAFERELQDRKDRLVATVMKRQAVEDAFKEYSEAKVTA